MSSTLKIIGLLAFFTTYVGCISSEKEPLVVLVDAKPASSITKSRTLSEEFKKYWYGGAAEITSYQLRQERYGQMREGTAVHIFVTEDFLPKTQVKADRPAKENVAVLKLNSTKKYLTGIYPYSVMNSTFSPINTTNHAIKLTHSIQEWCGMVYVQLNNREDFEIASHSYFQDEADQNFSLSKTWLESDLWNRIRINPEELPTGEIMIVPSFEYFRMSHRAAEAHQAKANLVQRDSITIYALSYPELKRELKIYFSSHFPYTVERWEETHANGLTTTAEKLKRIKTAYWSQNDNQYLRLRDTLQLPI